MIAVLLWIVVAVVVVRTLNALVGAYYDYRKPQ